MTPPAETEREKRIMNGDQGRSDTARGSPSGPHVLNASIAERLREVADLLSHQGANPFRVSAYRRAAATVVKLDEDL